MNKRLKIALTLIAIILIATLAISLAYSRYFSKITGTGTATVAKWNFKATSDGQAENLGTITLGNTTNSKVANGKIAPGTSGSFTVALDATGTEVALDYNINFKIVEGTFPTNLKFYKTKTGDVYSNEITDIETAGLTGSIGLNEEKKKDITIYWNWEYQTGPDANITSNDGIDTTEGIAANNVKFNVIVTGTQQK